MIYNNVPDSVLDPLCLTCVSRKRIVQHKGCMPFCFLANKPVCNGKFDDVPIITECTQYEKELVKYRQLSCL